jgi:hypothetical protein
VEAAGGGRCAVSTLTGSVTVGDAALVVLARCPEPAPVDDLLAELASGFSHTPSDRGPLLEELRAVVDRLLGVRALWLVAEEERDRSAQAAGARAGAGLP